MRILGMIVIVLWILHVGKCNPLLNHPNQVSIENQQQVEDIMDEANDDDKFEGDIVLTSHDKVDQSEAGDVDGKDSGSLSKRNAQRSRLYLWKDKIIPYEITVGSEYNRNIEAAIAEFHKHTCLRFVKRTNQKNWIRFVSKSGCWSSVGVKYWKPGYQEVSLGRGCNGKGTIMHELLHALGFWHEQSRPDRNQFVEVLWENIMKGKAHNFNKYSHGRIDTLKAVYDTKSIMHYGSMGFSKNGKPTLQGIGANKGVKLGQRKGFTKTDIFEINALYDCSASSKGWSAWSDFGPCDDKCNKIRQRFCASSDKSKCPGVGSHGTQSEQHKCPNTECYAPIDGHWGRWSHWSQCSVTCSIGTHNRTRQCDDPEPKNGGKPCVGNMHDVGKCEQRRCALGPDDCEFEINTCGWSQLNPANKFKWMRHSGKTPSSSTGPNGDVSVKKNGKGYYVYAESSSPAQPGQVAKLQSKKFMAAPNGRCMQFAYNMYGSTMGTLNVYVIDIKNGAKAQIFSKSGNQGIEWHRTNATIVSTHDFKISFEVTRGRNFRSDVALDDVFFKNGHCNRPPVTSRPTTARPTTARKTTARPTTARTTTARPTTSRPTTARKTTARPTTARPTTARPTTARPTTTRPTTARPTTSKPTTASPTTARPTTTTTTNPPLPGHRLDCDFDKDMCQWSAVKGSNRYNWMRHAKQTITWGTGPKGDHTTGKGHYVYMETSWQAGKGQTAYLVSPLLAPLNAHCLSFFYHMYGKTMGSLNVYVDGGNTNVLVFTKSGNQGNQWHYHQVSITETCTYKIIFEGVRGTSYRSDIAIDDILFTDGACS